MSIKTHCKDCVFAKYENSTQTGCTLNRVEKLGVEKTLDGSFKLNRFCNTHRPEEWIGTLSLEEQFGGAEKVALDEVKCRMGFFVRLDTSQNNAIAELSKTLKSIKEIEGGPAYIVVITDKVEYNEEVWGLFVTHFGEHSRIKYHIVQVTDTPEDIMLLVDEAFGHAQNGWVMTSVSGEIIDPNILSKLDKMINVDMRQVIMIEPSGDFSGLLFPAYLFKFLNGNKNKVFQDTMVGTGSFIEKIREAEERGDTKTILSWEEFYAA
jgi:hypothetical protein